MFFFNATIVGKYEFRLSNKKVIFLIVFKNNGFFFLSF